jgi:hypothetical protein
VDSLKPSKLSDKYLYVFFDTECTQDLENIYLAFEHIPNFTYAQQVCSKCETVDDVNADFEQCGKRVHIFWRDPEGNFIDYLRQSRQFAYKIYVI